MRPDPAVSLINLYSTRRRNADATLWRDRFNDDGRGRRGRDAESVVGKAGPRVVMVYTLHGGLHAAVGFAPMPLI
jgi:hypothetical protein